MRSHGTLIRWNDDRGFGFLALSQSREEIFVHISAFPKDGERPRVGETVSFEIRTAPDGRKRAEAVQRPGARRWPRPQRTTLRGRTGTRFGAVLSGVIVLGLGFAGYRTYIGQRDPFVPQVITPASEDGDQRFQCDGRTHCSQMTSCAEATYFLKHCPGVQMDGNGDGAPCEQQWCN